MCGMGEGNCHVPGSLHNVLAHRGKLYSEFSSTCVIKFAICLTPLCVFVFVSFSLRFGCALILATLCPVKRILGVLHVCLQACSRSCA